MNIAAIQALVQQRSGHSPVTLDDTAVRPLSDLLGHPDINDYVRHCLPQKTYLASKNQLAVQCLNGIIDEMHPKCSPGGCVRPFGYLFIASSAGGNAVCFHSPTGRVFWADHETFTPSGIDYEDHSTHQLISLNEYSSENVEKAMVPLSDNIEQFLSALLTDQLVEQLDPLD